MDHSTHDVRQAEPSSLKFIYELLMVNAHQMKKRRLEIMHVYGILHDVIAKVVGLAKTDSGFYAGSGNPHGKTTRVMISAIVVSCKLALRVYGAAKFPSPDN